MHAQIDIHAAESLSPAHVQVSAGLHVQVGGLKAAVDAKLAEKEKPVIFAEAPSTVSGAPVTTIPVVSATPVVGIPPKTVDIPLPAVKEVPVGLPGVQLPELKKPEVVALPAAIALPKNPIAEVRTCQRCMRPVVIEKRKHHCSIW